MPAFQKPPTVSDDYRAQDIYREAAQIIYAKGFDATSMGDIAEAVDLTKGGLYYYIKGKKALLFAIMNFAMDLLEREVWEPAKREGDAEKRLAKLLSGHLQLLIDDPSAMSILAFEDERLDDEHRQKILQRKRAYYSFARDTIAEVLAARGIEDVDPTIATNCMFGTTLFVVRWFRADGRLGKNEVIEQITRLVLHGLNPV
ncbi:MAG: TetR/AcrR family transcriptional regulator [Acidobacteria bacterium]|nr:MAG: TetR/AcrR family transcriptional regulator [Acidobacteriota bacterium]